MVATAAAARGFLEIIPTAVIFRTGYGETEQRERNRKNRKCDVPSRPASEYFSVLVFTYMQYQNGWLLLHRGSSDKL